MTRCGEVILQQSKKFYWEPLAAQCRIVILSKLVHY